MLVNYKVDRKEEQKEDLVNELPGKNTMTPLLIDVRIRIFTTLIGKEAKGIFGKVLTSFQTLNTRDTIQSGIKVVSEQVVEKNKETLNQLKELNVEQEMDMECVRQRDELYRN
ncbi:unnamed protein product [Lactuca saligna]|uniref:Uncharacterized protein n=1 Tax=Lactuca saligna TaxID=75948 RepID=A0AA36E7D1_LACSI|nr:unnamed protein product [Lactuca saligna]